MTTKIRNLVINSTMVKISIAYQSLDSSQRIYFKTLLKYELSKKIEVTDEMDVTNINDSLKDVITLLQYLDGSVVFYLYNYLNKIPEWQNAFTAIDEHTEEFNRLHRVQNGIDTSTPVFKT